jgi:uncharacterized protein Yka (UPF0111/DUF47 family)
LLDNLVKTCEDHSFWLNFKKAAPMLFCKVMDNNSEIKNLKDASFTEELHNVRSVISAIHKKLNSMEVDIDIIEYSMATNILEDKLRVLKAL